MVAWGGVGALRRAFHPRGLIGRGLDDPRERRCLVACVALCVGYIAVFGLFQVMGTRIDEAFLARRKDVLLQHLLRERLPFAVPVRLTEQGHFAASFLPLDGWSVAEPWGVWTDGAHADFAVALPEAGAATPVLQLWATIFLGAGGEQTLRLRTKGQTIGSWKLRDAHAVLCAPLPAGAASADGVLQIGIDILSPRSPPGGLDRRKLGLGLERVELLPDRSRCAGVAILPSK